MSKPKNKSKMNKSNLLNCVCFFTALIALPLLTAFLPKPDFSQTENRYLEPLPVLSLKSVADGTFMKGFEAYISDRFAGRDLWIKAKTGVELLAGRVERNGVYIRKERLLERVDEPDYASVDKSVAAINTFAATHDVPVYFMLAPTSAGIYSDMLPEHAPSLNQRDFIGYVYGGLSSDVAAVDIYSNLLAAKNEYIYYRTDHHWSTLGAYYAYAAAGNGMGYTPVSLNGFDVEHAGFDFKGTFHSKTLYDGTEADTLDIYRQSVGRDAALMVTEELGAEEKRYESIYFRSFLEQKDKYSVFLGQNQPLVTIVNESAAQDEKLLLIKDSYAHCFAPFLAAHYSEITLLDLRYVHDYSAAVTISDYDQVLILYNVSTFAEDINPRKLGFIDN